MPIIPRPRNSPPTGRGRFYGEGVVRQDFPWLTDQLFVIYDVMRDGRWRQLETIYELTGVKPATAGAQLRNLRREEHGSYLVEKERATDCGLDPKKGRFAYRVGRRGEGLPVGHTCERSRQLEEALRLLDPDHPLL